MDILYVTSSFDKKGSASVRNISLVNGLIANGENVDVLTQAWPEHIVDHDLKGRISEQATIYYDSIRVIDLYFSKIRKTNDNIKTNKKVTTLIKNIIKHFYYFPDIDKEWIKNFNKKIDFNKYDLIISSSDTKTSHFVAKNIVKSTPGLKWFQVWGDPWIDDKGTNGIRKALAYFYEKWLLQAGDKVFYVSKPTLNSMKQKYKASAYKMNYLKRSYLTEVRGTNSEERDNYNFSYIGSIYYGRNISQLVESIKEYNEKNKKKITLNIYGTYSNSIVNEYVNYKFINFCGFIEFNNVVEVISKSDALVFISNMKDSHQIPGKLFDYFGTDRSILALTEELDSPVSSFIKKTERVILFENKRDAIDLKKVINQVLQRDQKILYEYSSANVAKELLDFSRE